MGKTSIKLIANNKKAYHDFFIEDTFEAGISLHGTEVKSLRMGKCSIKEAFVRIENGEVFVYGMHISPYEKGNIFNKDPLRVKKLLMHRYEINKLMGKIKEKGLTLVPLKVYFKGSLVKVEIGLARGKKLYDKREDIAKKDQRREAEKEFKLRLSSLVLLGDVFPLVVELFTTGEADLHFHQAAFEIDFQRHQGEAFFFDFSHQFVDLIAVHEKFFHAQRVFVEDVSFLIGADMHAVDEDFAVFNPDEGFLDAAFSHTKGFHLRTVKGNAGLKGIFNKEVMIGFFVVRDEFYTCLSHFSLPLLFIRKFKINGPLFLAGIGHPHPKGLAQFEDSSCVHTIHFHRIFLIIIAVVVETGYMDQAFHGVGKLHIDTPVGDAGDHTVKFFTDMIFHILGFLELQCLPFGFVRPALGLTGLLCHCGKNLLVMISPLLSHTAPEGLLDNPVDLKIRIAADGRGEMAVITGRQAEVARTVRAVFGPFHTAESQAADQILLWGIGDFCQKLLEFFGMNLLPVAFDVVAEILDEALETLDFLRVRRLMHPVEKGDLLPVKILRHGLVRNEHKIFDELRGVVPVIGKDLCGMTVFVQMDLRLREIKVNGTPFSSVLPEKLCQYVHIFQHGDHIGVVFCKLRVLVRQDPFWPGCSSCDGSCGSHSPRSDGLSPGLFHQYP